MFEQTMYVRFDESFLQVQDSHPNVLKHQLSPSPDNGEKTTNTDRSRMVQTIQEFTRWLYDGYDHSLGKKLKWGMR